MSGVRGKDRQRQSTQQTAALAEREQEPQARSGRQPHKGNGKMPENHISLLGAAQRGKHDADIQADRAEQERAAEREW